MPLSASDNDLPPFGAPPRPLTDEVLQSAEEAVLTNPGSVEGMPEQGGVDVAPGAQEPSVPRAPYTRRLAQHVAEHPVQSALLAVAAGALMAAVVKAALQRRH